MVRALSTPTPRLARRCRRRPRRWHRSHATGQPQQQQRARASRQLGDPRIRCGPSSPQMTPHHPSGMASDPSRQSASSLKLLTCAHVCMRVCFCANPVLFVKFCLSTVDGN